MREASPLSRPKAAFNGHTGFPPSLQFDGGDVPTNGKVGEIRTQDPDEDAIGQDPSWEPEVYSMGKCLSSPHATLACRQDHRCFFR
jgi:hypothetical protein